MKTLNCPLTFRRIGAAFRASFTKSVRIAWWMIRLTVAVSLGVEILHYFGIIAWMSESLSPTFRLLGLPGEASLAFLTGYFVNVYGAIAVVETLSLGVRELTILGVMTLCAHNMFVETAVQKKTGSSVVRMVAVRTLGALASGFLAHWLLPGSMGAAAPAVAATAGQSLQAQAWCWLLSTGSLVLRMFVLIVALSFLQRLLAEFGVIRRLSKILRPVLKVFGLPAKASFLWIVANVLGLAYGAAVMIEEIENGKISTREVDLLNHHVGIAHSNLEDLVLFVACGALCWWLLLIRWFLALLLVWERRIEWRVENGKW
ncbi:MAG: nucleoside recognition protein [Prevotellaceae bacterium]|jgi:spore maturation protein SpmB|nr:nucleoside recognition protein [Prevotellaceae bacterium]